MKLIIHVKKMMSGSLYCQVAVQVFCALSITICNVSYSLILEIAECFQQICESEKATVFLEEPIVFCCQSVSQTTPQFCSTVANIL